jgi:hypothetical protein
MAALTRVAAVGLALAALQACQGDLQSLKDVHAPLVTIQVKVTGDLEALRPPDGKDKPAHLRVALVWGQQFASQAFCYTQGIFSQLPPGLSLSADPSAAAVYHAGCRDPFGFAFKQIGADVPVTVGEVTAIELDTLPSAAALVGDVTARVGYASLVVYDDRNGNGVLDALRANRLVDGSDEVTPTTSSGATDAGASTGNAGAGSTGGPGAGGQGPNNGPPDLVYAASFVTATRPDHRIAYREGSWVDSFFYPRPGCPPPPVGYSHLSAGGILFSLDFVSQALEEVAKVGPLALLTLGLPPEPTGTCVQEAADAQVIELALQPTEIVREVACALGGGGGSNSTGSVRYRRPPTKSLDLARPWLCQNAPGGKPAPGQAPQANVELVYAGPAGDCKVLGHYTLWGCQGDAYCKAPLDWDLRAHVPTWWPCPLTLPGKPGGGLP